MHANTNDDRNNKPQQKHRLGKVSKNIIRGLNHFTWPVSEEITTFRTDVAATREILYTITTKFVKDGIFNLYIFGNIAEDTMTGGLVPDIDYVYCIEEWRVVKNGDEIPDKSFDGKR